MYIQYSSDVCVCDLLFVVVADYQYPPSVGSNYSYEGEQVSGAAGAAIPSKFHSWVKGLQDCDFAFTNV